MALTDWSPTEIKELQAQGVDPRYASPSTPAPQSSPISQLGTVGDTLRAHIGSYLL